MKPEDVPDEWIRNALVNYFNDGRENLCDFDGDDSRAMEDALAAVLPEHERQMRAKLSDEIYDMPHEGFNSTYDRGLDAAAEQVRGDQP